MAPSGSHGVRITEARIASRPQPRERFGTACAPLLSHLLAQSMHPDPDRWRDALAEEDRRLRSLLERIEMTNSFALVTLDRVREALAECERLHPRAFADVNLERLQRLAELAERAGALAAAVAGIYHGARLAAAEHPAARILEAGLRPLQRAATPPTTTPEPSPKGAPHE